ncbi:TVP38/TMEM64 family protein [Halomarina litorea]|uniref:TVP38/TMEM64 family protein n=1 Tax=Halomarina litorea TaxID=2961595 RepID=UPI0020C3DAF2|nr:VTT domain-containing protein [Halomarina sp. BCD28]
MNGATRRQVTGLSLAAAVVLALSLAFSPSHLLSSLVALGEDPLAFGLVLVGLALVRPFLAWPVGVLAGLAGYVLGLAGLPVAFAVVVLTTLPPYLFAWTTRPTEGVLGRAGATGADLFATTGDTRGVLAARLAPVPTDVVSYGAGLARVRFRPFLLGTALGEVPWVVASVVAGSSMERLTAEGLSAGLPLVAGGAAVATLLLAGPVYERLAGGVAAD